MVAKSQHADSKNRRFYSNTTGWGTVAQVREKEKVTITYNGNNASSGNMENQNVYKGETAKLTKNAFERTGFEFKGWDTNSDGTNVVYTDEGTTVALNGNLTLYAVWKEKQPQVYTVSLASMTGGTVEVTDADGKACSSFTAGSTVYLKVKADNNYQPVSMIPTVCKLGADGTSGDAITTATNNYLNYYFTMPDCNVRVSANFTTYKTITATSNNVNYGTAKVREYGNVTWSQSLTRVKGIAIEIKAWPNPGYFFKEWKVTPTDTIVTTTPTGETIVVMDMKDVTVQAVFVEGLCLTLDPGGRLL